MGIVSHPVRYRARGLRSLAAAATVAIVLAEAVLAGSFVAVIVPAKPNGPPMPSPEFALKAATFADLPGWEHDDHLAAWKAFVASCEPVLRAARGGSKAGAKPAPAALRVVCELALLTAGKGDRQTKAGARAFFETHFTPHSVQHGATEGLLTGYYEPLVHGSRQRGDGFLTPIYKRPGDLVNIVAESERGAKSAQFTHMRRTDDGLVPYFTRAEIEQGALTGQNLELIYFRDPVDVYFMQIQGSARVKLPDGSKVRITYDGKNGYPYTSVGRMLIDDGSFKPEKMSLKSLASWLKADRKRAEQMMWQNKSYVFFRELQGVEADGAMGVLKIALQPGRSLAVDTAFHAIGTPIYVSAPALTHAAVGPGGFARLMVAHDVGSAIKGAERGDIFFGSGDKAGRTAGVIKHPGRFFVLLPSERRSEPQIAGPGP